MRFRYSAGLKQKVTAIIDNPTAFDGAILAWDVVLFAIWLSIAKGGSEVHNVIVGQLLLGK